MPSSAKNVTQYVCQFTTDVVTQVLDLLSISCLNNHVGRLENSCFFWQVPYAWPGTPENMDTVDGVLASRMLCSVIGYYMPHLIPPTDIKSPLIERNSELQIYADTLICNFRD